MHNSKVTPQIMCSQPGLSIKTCQTTGPSRRGGNKYKRAKRRDLKKRQPKGTKGQDKPLLKLQATWGNKISAIREEKLNIGKEGEKRPKKDEGVTA